MKTKLLFISILLISAISCTDTTKTYTGKEIELDFRGVNTFEDLSWIKIDGIKYIHHQNFVKQRDSLSIPASKTVYYINEQEKFEPNNPFAIALILAGKVDYFSLVNDNNTASIKEDKRHLLHISALIYLENKNGGDVVIETPEDYPLKITVLN